MTENTNTPQSERTKSDPEAWEGEDPFKQVSELQAALKANTGDSHPDDGQAEPGEPTTKPERFSKSDKFVAAAALAAGAVFAGPEIVDRMNGPEFSEQTTTFTALDGEGLDDAAEAVQGWENIYDKKDIVNYISSMPVNIDALKDGLQNGETITIPVSVEK